MIGFVEICEGIPRLNFQVIENTDFQRYISILKTKNLCFFNFFVGYTPRLICSQIFQSLALLAVPWNVEGQCIYYIMNLMDVDDGGRWNNSSTIYIHPIGPSESLHVLNSEVNRWSSPGQWWLALNLRCKQRAWWNIGMDKGRGSSLNTNRMVVGDVVVKWRVLAFGTIQRKGSSQFWNPATIPIPSVSFIFIPLSPCNQWIINKKKGF